jgi:hypothetical protein
MASQPLRRALVKALGHRAHETLGAQATALEYVEYWLRSGQTLQGLSLDIEADLGRTPSRKFVSFVCNRLGADARLRIQVARTTRLKRPPKDLTPAHLGSQPAPTSQAEVNVKTAKRIKRERSDCSSSV